MFFLIDLQKGKILDERAVPVGFKFTLISEGSGGARDLSAAPLCMEADKKIFADRSAHEVMSWLMTNVRKPKNSVFWAVRTENGYGLVVSLPDDTESVLFKLRFSA